MSCNTNSCLKPVTTYDGEEKKVYPVDVFSRILTETADQHGVARAMAAAIEYAKAKTPVVH